jgi:phospholipid/cholesterol/gamma-HCH transport system substrate-binding protein
MNNNHNELKVGIAILLSLIILVGGVMWGKGFSIEVRRYTIRVDFQNIGGLSEGADVLANGVKSGRITSVNLHEGAVTVEASIDKRVKIFSDYKVTIESPTLMAGKVLAIYPGGKPPMVEPGQALHGEEPLGVGEGIAMVQNLAKDIQTALGKLNLLLVSLNQIAGDSANQKNISSLLKNASDMTKTSNEWLHENRTVMTSVLEKLESTITVTQAMVKTTEAQAGTTLEHINSAAVEIDSLSSSLHGMVLKLEGGQGTMGRLLTEDSLYVKLSNTLAQVDSLAHSIRTKGLRNKIVLF